MKTKLSMKNVFDLGKTHRLCVSTRLLFIILALSPMPLALSQIPQGFNYQAIARDASGIAIKNTALPITITIQSDSLGGSIFWEELHSSVTTNGFGVFTLVIGKGVKQTSSSAAFFDDINWSNSPKFIKTQVFYKSELLNMGSSRLWSVPFSISAGDLSGPVDKLEVAGKTDLMDEALFEVKNRDGQTVFAVYNEGVRIYVSDERKAVKGGFAVGGFGTDKEESTKYLFVGKDSVRIYLDTNPETKKLKGGFAVGGYDLTKGTLQDYFVVEPDSIRAYIDTNPAKKLKGGFAVGGFDMTKDASNEFFRVTSDSVKVSKSLLIPRLTIEERDNLPFIPGEALIIFNVTEGCMQIYKNSVWSNIWCFNCAPSFIIQPVDNTICSGNNVILFVSATGTNLFYQWQESQDNGNTWNNISNGGSSPVYSGANGYTLLLSNVPVGYQDYKYRCIVSGSCLPNATSNAVTLNVGSTPPVISLQPTDQILSTGCTAIFSIVSPGYGVAYQWQESSDGGVTWSDISDGGIGPIYSGVTSSSLTLSNVPLLFNNYKYRCIASNLCGANATSTTATLTISIMPEITVQPENKTVYAGQKIVFSITTSGTGYNYLWQESTDGGNTWSNLSDGGSNPSYSGVTTLSLILSNLPITYNNYKFRCLVGNYCRPDLLSDDATLLVFSPSPVMDIDGNTYNTVGIGSQLWMAENLKSTKYSDGTAITDYKWYDNNINNKDIYGALYKWPAAMNNASASSANPSGVQGACPTGWHLPSDAEWSVMETYLGGSSIAGGKMKETGISHWKSPNTGATNESGFTGLPGGDCDLEFWGLTSFGCWWSTTYAGLGYFARHLSYNSTSTNRVMDMTSKYISVRCVKD